MISVKGLDYTYVKSKKHAVKDISFHIGHGEIFGLLGPSGAGKTTTQRLLIGLLQGYAGSVEIMGKERSVWGKEFYESIGVAFDFPNLYLKLTAKENLKLVSSYYKNQVYSPEDLLDMVGLLPDMDKRVEGYSKGMKMRLNFVRSLMHDPQLLFFDEPTSGLDPVNAKIIKDIILSLKDKGKTIFLTTHNMTVAEQLCDQVAFMSEGKIPVIDTPNNLMIAHGEQTVRVLSKEGAVSTYNMERLNENSLFMNLLNSDSIQTIHSNDATLEDVFIQLTGRSLT